MKRNRKKCIKGEQYRRQDEIEILQPPKIKEQEQKRAHCEYRK